MWRTRLALAAVAAPPKTTSKKVVKKGGSSALPTVAVVMKWASAGR